MPSQEYPEMSAGVVPAFSYRVMHAAVCPDTLN